MVPKRIYIYSIFYIIGISVLYWSPVHLSLVFFVVIKINQHKKIKFR